MHRNLLDLLAAAAYLLNFEYDSTMTTLLYLIACFDYSVIHTWGIDKSKAVIGGVTVPQTWREHLPENGS